MALELLWGLAFLGQQAKTVKEPQGHHRLWCREATLQRQQGAGQRSIERIANAGVSPVRKCNFCALITCSFSDGVSFCIWRGSFSRWTIRTSLEVAAIVDALLRHTFRLWFA